MRSPVSDDGHKCAPVAQLDRVPGYEPGGRGFESYPAHQKFLKTVKQQCLTVFCLPEKTQKKKRPLSREVHVFMNRASLSHRPFRSSDAVFCRCLYRYRPVSPRVNPKAPASVTAPRRPPFAAFQQHSDDPSMRKKRRIRLQRSQHTTKGDVIGETVSLPSLPGHRHLITKHRINPIDLKFWRI